MTVSDGFGEIMLGSVYVDSKYFKVNPSSEMKALTRSEAIGVTRKNISINSAMSNCTTVSLSSSLLRPLRFIYLSSYHREEFLMYFLISFLSSFNPLLYESISVVSALKYFLV